MGTVLKGRGGACVYSTGYVSHFTEPEKHLLIHHRGQMMQLFYVYIYVFSTRDPDGAILPPCCTSVLIGRHLSQITQWPLNSTVRSPCILALNHALILKLINGYQGGQLISCKFTLVIQLIQKITSEAHFSLELLRFLLLPAQHNRIWRFLLSLDKEGLVPNSVFIHRKAKPKQDFEGPDRQAWPVSIACFNILNGQ